MKKVLGILFVSLLILNASCIIGPTSKRVMSYRNDNVYLSDKSHFKVGELSSGWKRMRVPAHAIAFHNAEYGATIATDAFCGPSYEDLPLNRLTSYLLAGVDSYKVESQKEFMLDDRGALKTIARGKVDGVPLIFDIVVIKKNKCNIDLMCMSPEGAAPLAQADFLQFYSGFHYE